MTLHVREEDARSFSLDRYIKAGDTISWGQASAEPTTLTALLVEQRATLGGVRCILGIPVADTFRPEHADHLAFLSYCATGSNRRLNEAGALDIVPSAYSDFPDLLRTGNLRPDVAFVLLSPPDAEGRYSFGPGVDFTPDVVSGARIVIAEVSDRVPYTYGGPFLLEDDLDVVLHSAVAPAERATPVPSANVLAIARRVAELVEDRATLQFGLGAIPEAVLGLLQDRRDLGIHTGFLCDAVLPLIESGTVTNERKTVDVGKSVAGLLIGTTLLFNYAHRNALLSIRETRYTHDRSVLAAQDQFVAINSALEVDLTGQVNSESIDGRYLGAIGGAGDFLRGAARSNGGIPIVALPAERIVSALSGPASVARSDAGVIVTEHGSVDLRGRTLAHRRELMISIAHPANRATLDTTTPGLVAQGR